VPHPHIDYARVPPKGVSISEIVMCRCFHTGYSYCIHFDYATSPLLMCAGICVAKKLKKKILPILSIHQSFFYKFYAVRSILQSFLLPKFSSLRYISWCFTAAISIVLMKTPYFDYTSSLNIHYLVSTGIWKIQNKMSHKISNYQ